MKRSTVCLFVFVSVLSYGQCEITMQPGPNDGKDAYVWSLDCNSSYAQLAPNNCMTDSFPDEPVLRVMNWTWSNTPAERISYIEFNLDSLAAIGCTAVDAKLVLYADMVSSSYSCGQSSTIHPCLNNAMDINRVTSPWTTTLLTWINQPSYSNTTPGLDLIQIPNEDEPYETIEIDLTDMVNYWLANPSQNFGMRMQLALNSYYNAVRFGSSENPNQSIRPKLIITASCPGSCANIIEGDVYDDANSDCNFDNGENGLANWMVKIEPGPIYATTDVNGHYSAWVDDTTYTVTQFIPNTYLWDSICPLPYEHQLSGMTFGQVSSGNDFAVHADTYCADLWVDIGANFLRPCHTELYYVHYCNNGNDTAYNVYVDTDFAAMLVPSSSSVPWSLPQNGTIYSFDIGTLAPGDCGAFTLNVVVDCAAQIGETWCVEATIFPPPTCTEPIDPAWDKSSVMVNGSCVGDSLVCFTITNTGDPIQGDMQGTSEYRIFVDNVLMFTGNFQIPGGADTVICWPANGGTIRLEADQRPGHPGNSNPNDIIENCGGTGSPMPGQSMVNSMPQDDADPFKEVECLEVIASFDPNDKTPTPEGYGVDNFIVSDLQIEYRIRFQNTGNDTAFNIIVRDTIDTEVLDIASIIPGVSSHFYEYEVYGNGIIKFTFPTILLVDSVMNEPLSHGFIKFKINQKPGNVPGTRIENQVDIYFDYNDPVETNVALNTIQFSTPVGVASIYKENFEIHVYPNPFNTQTTFDMVFPNKETVHFQLYDLMGKKVREINNITTSKFLLDRGYLDSGVYVYTIRSNLGVLSKGRLVVN